MDTRDTNTVPLGAGAGLSDRARELVNRPREKPVSMLVGCTPLLPVDHPEIAEQVQDLESLFPVADTERKFFEDEQVATNRAKWRATAAKPDASRNYIQAHSVIIDQLLMDPGITTTALASATGYSRQWLHKIMCADSFQAKLAERQKAICDPIVLSAIKDRLNGIVSRSLEILEERLDTDKVSIDHALAVFTAGSKAMGLGQIKAAPVAQQFIVHMPAPGMSAKGWAEQYSQSASGIVTMDEGSGATEVELAQTINAASSDALGDISTVGAVIREVQDDN